LDSEKAADMLARYGKNEIREKKKKSFLRRFFEALCDRMTVVLLIAAAISFATSYVSGEGFADPIIIFVKKAFFAIVNFFKRLPKIRRKTTSEKIDKNSVNKNIDNSEDK
jgi:magnesium-transporting ATPase (P-type)